MICPYSGLLTCEDDSNGQIVKIGKRSAHLVSMLYLAICSPALLNGSMQCLQLQKSIISLLLFHRKKCCCIFFEKCVVETCLIHRSSSAEGHDSQGQPETTQIYLHMYTISTYKQYLHIFTAHTVSWLNSSVTLLVSKAPLNRTVKNGCFWVDPPFRFRVQKADPPINFPLLTKCVTWDTV